MLIQITIVQWFADNVGITTTGVGGTYTFTFTMNGSGNGITFF